MDVMLLIEVTDVVIVAVSVYTRTLKTFYIFFVIMKADDYYVSPVVVGVSFLGKSVEVTEVVTIIFTVYNNQ